MIWYFRGIERDKAYKAPHANLIDVFSTLKYDDDQIKKEMDKYKIKKDWFYYYMGLAHHDKKNFTESLKYYQKAYSCAEDINKELYKIHNSIGVTYDDMK